MARADSGLPEQIADKIIQLILDEHLEQGDRLPKEAVLVERLGAGRSTVREAMKLLQSRNIVRIKQGSGTYVASNPGVADDPLGFTFIDDKQRLARDLLEVRFMIEPQMASMAQSTQLTTRSSVSKSSATNPSAWPRPVRITPPPTPRSTMPLPRAPETSSFPA